MTETIASAVEQFIAHKRAHGHKYHSEARELALLVRFAAGRDISCLSGLTPALLEDFLASRPRPHPRSFNHLLGIVRTLLDWAVTWGLLEASPLQARRRRVTAARIPFLFDPVQARRLLDAAAALPDGPRAPARGPAYHAIFALCYGLGLRAGEACSLRLGDVDAGRSLIVRGGKFGKHRLVPHGPRIAALVSEHVARRARAGAADDWAPLFTFDGRRPVHPGTASQAFHHLVATLDLPVPDGVSPPRLHDLRHSFAVGCLLRWYQEGLDPSVRLCQLSTFMGHVEPRSTSVYLTMTPQLLAEASRRFEAFAAPAWLDPGGTMTRPQPPGPVLHSYFASHLITVKGLRPASVRSYRDTVRLFLVFAAAGKGCKITRLALDDLTFDRVVAFLRHLEHDRGNHASTRNQRLAALHCLFDYIAGREPEMLATCQQVAAIPVKRTTPPETRFLEQDEIEDLLRRLPRDGPLHCGTAP